jgi:ubiquinone/menaquinone biosynthesis C-methylase UbiE
VIVADALNPQQAQMADESMVRNLAAQASAIWPQEAPLFDRYRLPEAPRILDAGCGTGEASWRLARAFPGATVLGVDVLEGSLEQAHARARAEGLEDRVRFENRSIFGLELPGASFDLVVCRHVLQSIPHADRAIAELVRVTRPGGTVHLVAEDYGMIHFPRRRLDPGRLWPVVPERFGAATGTDMLVGRRAPSILAALGLEAIAVDHLVVDTLRVRRPVFARIWEAWRDGYAEVVAEHGGMSREEAVAHFDDQIATILDPASYAAWIVPVVSGEVPAASAGG